MPVWELFNLAQTGISGKAWICTSSEIRRDFKMGMPQSSKPLDIAEAIRPFSTGPSSLLLPLRPTDLCSHADLPSNRSTHPTFFLTTNGNPAVTQCRDQPFVHHERQNQRLEPCPGFPPTHRCACFRNPLGVPKSATSDR